REGAGTPLPGTKQKEDEKAPEGREEQLTFVKAGVAKEYEGPDFPSEPKFDLKFDVFEVGGYPPDRPAGAAPLKEAQKGKKAPKEKEQAAPKQKEGGEGAGKRLDGVSADKQPDKLLVRFVDPDVEPGRTYYYTVAVRVANPNFGKRNEVAYEDLARAEELVSPPVQTEAITIPGELHFYVADQKLLEGKDWKAHKGADDKTA